MGASTVLLASHCSVDEVVWSLSQRLLLLKVHVHPCTALQLLLATCLRSWQPPCVAAVLGDIESCPIGNYTVTSYKSSHIVTCAQRAHCLREDCCSYNHRVSCPGPVRSIVNADAHLNDRHAKAEEGRANDDQIRAPHLAAPRRSFLWCPGRTSACRSPSNPKTGGGRDVLSLLS